MKNQIATYCLGIKLFLLEYIHHIMPITNSITKYEKFSTNHIFNTKNVLIFSNIKEKHVSGYKGKTTNKLDK